MPRPNLRHSRKSMIEKRLLIILKPFYYSESIVCIRKFNKYQDSVESTCIKNVFPLIVTSFSVIILFLISLKQDNFIAGADLPTYYPFVYYIINLQYTVNYLIAGIVNLYYSKAHVRLLKVLVKIISSVHTEEELKTYKEISWISCIIIFLYYLTLLIGKLYLDTHWTIIRALFISLSILFDLEIIQTTVFVLILIHQVKKCNNYMTDINVENSDVDTIIRIKREAIPDEMHTVMKDVLMIWEIIKESNKLNVSYLFLLLNYET